MTSFVGAESLESGNMLLPEFEAFGNPQKPMLQHETPALLIRLLLC